MVLAGPRLLVVGAMTTHATQARHGAAAGQQDALFGDPAPSAPQKDHDGAPVQDPELVADVVRTADGTGFLLIERTQRVVKADPATPGVVDSVRRDEQDAVLQLLDSGHLRTGGTHHLHHHGHEGPARSILVTKATRDMVTRWSNLRPVPAPRPADPAPAPTGSTRKRRPDLDGGQSGAIVVDVIRPGRGFVTCREFNGQIIRENGRYLVETEFGVVVGRASSYRLGAELLARHHGYTPGPVEVDHTERGDGNAPPAQTADGRPIDTPRRGR